MTRHTVGIQNIRCYGILQLLLGNIGKACLTVAAGWLLYWTVIKRASVVLPKAAEQFDHLIGTMSLVLLLLFWRLLL